MLLQFFEIIHFKNECVIKKFKFSFMIFEKCEAHYLTTLNSKISSLKFKTLYCSAFNKK